MKNGIYFLLEDQYGYGLFVSDLLGRPEIITFFSRDQGIGCLNIFKTLYTTAEFNEKHAQIISSKLPKKTSKAIDRFRGEFAILLAKAILKDLEEDILLADSLSKSFFKEFIQ